MVVVHQSELTKAIDAIESRFYLDGTAYRGIKLTVGQNACDFPMSKADAAAKLPGLFSAARESAFGKGSETVLDPSVRIAQELKANEFSIDFDPQAQGILAEIHRALVPEAGAVRAELYKLNIMTKGGFFKAHKDTPRGDAATCFGTLVVVLPVPFTGGQLTLAHGDRKATFNWHQRLQCPHSYSYGFFGNPQQALEAEQRVLQFVPSAAGLQWAAFFGDVEHEVLPVTDGHRVTLTYTLHRDSALNPNVDALLTRASGFHTTLRAALEDPEWMAEGGAIGFKCRHLYEESALAQAEAKLAAGGAAAYAAKLKLKNEDAVIAAVLAALGLEVQCVRLLQMEYLEEDYVLKKMPTKKDAASFGCREYIEESFAALGCDDDSIAAFCTGTVADTVGEDVEWVGSHEGANKQWVERWYSCTGYFGNEASTATFYTAAAFVAKIPPFARRKKLITAAKRTALKSEVVNPAAAAAAATGHSRRRSEGASAAAAAAPAAPAAAAAGGRTSGRKRKSRELPKDEVALLDSDEDYYEDNDKENDVDADRGYDQENQGDEVHDDDVDDSDADYSSDQDSDDDGSSRKKKKVTGSSAAAAAAAARSAAAPPVLFPAADPSTMTAKQRQQAALNRARVIHVTGGQGGKAGNGSCTVQLQPGQGVKELKQILRRTFGKVSHSKLGPLMLVDAQGNRTSTSAKAADLVDGVKVHCTYTYARGNVANLASGGFMGGGFGRRRGWGGFGGCGFWM